MFSVEHPVPDNGNEIQINLIETIQKQTISIRFKQK